MPRNSHLEKFKIAEHLKANWSEITEKHYTKQVVCHGIKHHLKIEVSSRGLGMITKHYLGLKWPVPDQEEQKPASTVRHSTSTDRKIRYLAKVVRGLARQVRALMEAMGETEFHPDFQMDEGRMTEIIGGRRARPDEESTPEINGAVNGQHAIFK